MAPVKSFLTNSLNIYDMAGNVWEMTKDNFDVNYYKSALTEGEIINPTGSVSFYNPDNQYQKEK